MCHLFWLLLSKVMSRLAPAMQVKTNLELTDISRDPVEAKAYGDDPLIQRVCHAALWRRNARLRPNGPPPTLRNLSRRCSWFMATADNIVNISQPAATFLPKWRSPTKSSLCMKAASTNRTMTFTAIRSSRILSIGWKRTFINLSCL